MQVRKLNTTQNLGLDCLNRVSYTYYVECILLCMIFIVHYLFSFIIF
jgi:uncharacterized membrane protein YagU involved in acid resistance